MLRIIISAWLLCSSILCIGAPYSYGAARDFRVVFENLDNSHAGPYAKLRNSFQTMLVSRLAAKNRIMAVEPDMESNELRLLLDQEQELQNKLGKAADFILTGSLLQRTKGFEAEVVLYPLRSDRKVMQFSVLCEDVLTMMESVDILVDDISVSAFGYTPHPIVEGKKQVDGTDGFITVHPEKAYRRQLIERGMSEKDSE